MILMRDLSGMSKNGLHNTEVSANGGCKNKKGREGQRKESYTSRQCLMLVNIFLKVLKLQLVGH